jgi:hypothetical protein
MSCENEDIRVCSHCGEEINVVSSGDESWDWCENCQQFEGPTHYVSQEEYENR